MVDELRAEAEGLPDDEAWESVLARVLEPDIDSNGQEPIAREDNTPSDDDPLERTSSADHRVNVQKADRPRRVQRF